EDVQPVDRGHVQPVPRGHRVPDARVAALLVLDEGPRRWRAGTAASLAEGVDPALVAAREDQSAGHPRPSEVDERLTEDPRRLPDGVAGRATGLREGVHMAGLIVRVDRPVLGRQLRAAGSARDPASARPGDDVLTLDAWDRVRLHAVRASVRADEEPAI